MKTTVKHTSDTRVLVTITLAEPELEAAEQVALKKLAKTTKVSGFRKGHVPLDMVKKHADPQLLSQEALENALSRAVAEAFLEKNLQALERPEVEVKKYVPGETLEFTAEADVLPEVTLGDYRKLKAEKPKIVVEKSDVEEVVERIRSSFATKKSVKRAAAMGDEVTIDFLGKKDGVAFDGGEAKDYRLALGSQSFIPGFEDAVVGHKIGDSFDVPLTFPDEYHAKDLAGQPVVFAVTLKNIEEQTLPELDDEFAAKVGPFTDIAALRADIKKEITAQKEREAMDAIKDDLVKQLVEKSKVTAPKVLVEDQVASIERDLTQDLMYQGMSFEQYLKDKGFDSRETWIEKEAREVAEMRVKAGLVLAELSKQEKIEATADELAERINAYKQQYANSPETVKRFDEPEIQRSIANELLTAKTVDELLKLNLK